MFQQINCGEQAPVPESPQSAIQQISMQNLGKVSKTMSRMNVLIVQKLSIIVAEYFNLVDKVQEYCRQIETLIEYNKRLIEVLKVFEEQEQNLISRLKTMEQFNLEYLKAYSQMKGLTFKAQDLPHHQSIFFKFHLQDLQYVGVKLQPPVLDPDYKKEMIGIVQKCFLTSQDDLLTKVEAKLQNCNPKQKQELQDIKKMIGQYNTLMEQDHKQAKEIVMEGESGLGQKQYARENLQIEEGYGKERQGELMERKKEEGRETQSEREDKRFFNLLKIRSQIRKRVEEFYDKNSDSEIKPDYEKEDTFISKIIHLHAKMQEMDEGAITDFLKAEKDNRTTLEKERVEIQQTIEKRLIEFEEKVEYKQKEIIELKSTKQELEEKLSIVEAERQVTQRKIQQRQELISQLQTQNTQLVQQIQALKAKPTCQEVATHTKGIVQLRHEVWDILQIDNVADVESLKRLQVQIIELQLQLEESKGMNEEKQKRILQLSQKVQVSAISHQQKMQQLAHGLQLAKQENEEHTKFRYMVQALAASIFQALGLACKIEINEKVRDKLNKINEKFQSEFNRYQVLMKWNIQNQSPDFFLDYSLQTNQSNGSLQPSFSEIDKKGYSFDLTNVKLIKDVIEQKKKLPELHQSFRIERPLEFEYSPVAQKDQSVMKSPRGVRSREMSLNISNELHGDVDREQYDNLYKNYLRSVECLSMEEKKTKNFELDYQRFVEIIKRKEDEDPINLSLQKQLVYLMKLTKHQQETIETERKEYNEIFKQYQEEHKDKMAESLRSLKERSIKAQSSVRSVSDQ